MSKVFVGVGHGGVDSGAVGNGFLEKDLALSISLACRDELERNGVTVQISRETDITNYLVKKIDACNKFSPDLAIDIHINAGGGDGVEAYYQHDNKTSKTFSDNVINEIVKIGQNSRGSKTKLTNSGTDWFGFVRRINCPSILLECAFIDTADIEIIDTEEERKTFGIAIAKGILKTLGIEHKADNSSISTSTSISTKKSIDEIAKEVLNGKWGNGTDRKNKLTAAGYDYDAVQKKVNELLGNKSSTSTSTKKSIDEIAKEVLNGKWGNGTDRKNKLTAAGYDYDAIQKKVNELLGNKSSTSAKKSIDEIAREVIDGKWGNGYDRKKRLTAAGYDYTAVQKRVNELL